MTAQPWASRPIWINEKSAHLLESIIVALRSAGNNAWSVIKSTSLLAATNVKKRGLIFTVRSQLQ